jgi:hypothetical protein
MFENIYSLPDSKAKAAILDRNVQADGQQCGLDMGRHVVGAFIGVGQIGHFGVSGWWHEAVEIIL